MRLENRIADHSPGPSLSPLDFSSRWQAPLVDSRPRVFIVDDDSAYVESLAALIKTMGFPVSFFVRPQDYLDSYDASAAGCLIVDLKMPDLDGLSLIQTMSQKSPATPIIVMTGHADVTAAVLAFRKGVVAFLQKQNASESALWEAIQQAFLLDAERRAAHARRAELEARRALLSAEERAVMELLVRGSDHSRIAEVLGISRRTVENRRARVMKKLGVTTFAQLVRVAMETGGVGEP
jgi:FixJ family two-component response regulator